MHDVVLHAFNWTYETIANRANEIAQAGYGAVLFPPVLYSQEDSGYWWQRYQPKDYRVLRSRLGRKAALEAALEALRRAGVRALADIVFNHMANEKTMRQDRGEADLYDFPGKYELDRYRNERVEFRKDRLYGNLDDGLFRPRDFNPEGDISDWRNPERVQEQWLSGLPDLDLTDWVVDQQCTCLRALCDLGFSGYRIDAMKHLPVEHLLRVFTIDALDDKFVFGEVLTTNDQEETTFLWPVIRHTQFPCYDFALHETLRRVFLPSGRLRELVDPAAYGQALPWQRAVTFSVTHDIPNNRTFRGMMLGAHDEYLANAYIMGRDGGVPLVYSDQNESAGDHPDDRDRWAGAWNRYDIVQMIRFHNAVHALPQRCLYEADGFLVLARGDCGIVAINKTEEWQCPTIWTWGLRQGNYRCQIHQHVMRVQGETFNFAIPPRQAQMWLAE
ncbi:MAG: alpha-amylase [Deltaproteobacteria bacterium]|nr:alpha-amylase [Deltaproteobacteria bacterium]